MHAVGRQQLLVLFDPRTEVRAADLFFALDQELEDDRPAAAPRAARPGGPAAGHDAALVVGRTTPVEYAVDDLRRPRPTIRPRLDRLRRLHVIVRVAEHRLLARPLAFEFAKNHRRPLVELLEFGRQAVAVHHVPHQRRALAQPDVLRGNTWLANESLEVGNVFVGVCVDVGEDVFKTHAAVPSDWTSSHASRRLPLNSARRGPASREKAGARTDGSTHFLRSSAE